MSEDSESLSNILCVFQQPLPVTFTENGEELLEERFEILFVNNVLKVRIFIGFKQI